MIEVEKKFSPTENQLSSLLLGAKLISEGEHEDVYYDLPGFLYFKQGIRLRKRNGKYELKIELPGSQKKSTSQKREIENESDILKQLRLDVATNLDDFVRKQMIVLCSFSTKRREYKKGEFIVDIDETDFGYKVCEIELQVEDKTEVLEAEAKILALAIGFGFSIKKMPGKVTECLRIKNPEIYEILGKNKAREISVK